MLRNLREYIGYTVLTADGEIGEISDFYIDDYNWSIRYLVVSGKDRLSDRLLFFAPPALGQLDYQAKEIHLKTSREMVERSPKLSTNQPLSRHFIMDLHRYFDWPVFWKPENEGAVGIGSLAAYPMAELVEEMEEEQSSPDGEPEIRLRSAKRIFGFKIEARDGSIGKVADFIIDDRSWNLLYVVVDTGGWLTGRKVLISPQWVEAVDWRDSNLQVDLSQETIRNSPEYDPSEPLDREYETRLYDYYGRDRYW